MTPAFTDPYKSLPEEKRTRVQFDAHEDDVRFLSSIRSDIGTKQIILGMFFNWLIHECKRRNITSYTEYPRLEALMSEQFSPNGPSVQAGECPDVGNERGGTPTDSAPSTNEPNLPSHLQRDSGERGTGGGSNPKGKKGKGGKGG